MGRAKADLRDPVAGGELARAAAAAEGGNLATALAHALEAWRACGDEELAQLIEELGRAVPATMALPAAGGRAQDAAFVACAVADEPADLELLLASPAPRALGPFAARLRALAGRAPDPRLATYLHGLLARPPFGTRPFWKLGFELLVGVADRRSIARLVALGPELPRLARTALGPPVEQMRERAVRARRELAPVARALTPVQADGLARLGAALADRTHAAAASGQSGAELHAAILAHPADDQARQVYADWLQERGDPRGELIALQLAPPSPAATRRIRALITEHGKRWLGVIGPVAVLPRSRFERGFPAAVVIAPRSAPQLDPVIGAPEWATVEELRFSATVVGSPACATVVMHPVMRALRTVRGLAGTSIATVATSPRALPLTTLGVFLFDGVPDELLAGAPGLPALAHLVVERPSYIVGLADIEDLVASTLAARLQSLATHTGTCTLTLQRDAAGELRRLRVDPGSPSAPALRTARGECHDYAAAFPAIAEVVVVAPPGKPLTGAQVRQLLGPLGTRPHTLETR